ncbi:MULTISPECIES: hypothetical protein [Nocardioides]|uniref:HEAT repeat domain-containing protein n=1 Tax=Nocardioides kribbensis TaxID=305517 RepID=A0ABV1P1N6_9ACTN|nr:hypothetical protein [Nocardioides sp. P86]MCM3516419.1 hypothetical protein [Nocardioides sp. P86]
MSATGGPTEPDYSGIDAMTRGDQRQARQLRATLAVIARRTEDPDLRRLCVSVLGGEQSVRRVFEHPTFWAMASRNYENLEEGIARLSPEEREQVTERLHDPGGEITDDAVVQTLQEEGRMPPEDPPPGGAPARDDRGPSRWG